MDLSPSTHQESFHNDKPSSQDLFMEQLESLLKLQYRFLERNYRRTGELPAQALNGNKNIGKLLKEVFGQNLDADERDGVIFALDTHFKVLSDLCRENGDFPGEKEAWELFQDTISQEYESLTA